MNHEAVSTKQYVQSPLTIAISEDDKGMAFPFVRDLETACELPLPACLFWNQTSIWQSVCPATLLMLLLLLPPPRRKG